MADALLVAAPTVAVRELASLPMARLRLRRPTANDLIRVGALIGAIPPTVPNTTVAADTMQVIWHGPDEWLIVGRPVAYDAIEKAATDATSALCVNVGDGRCAFDVTGHDAAELLAKGTSIDLDRVISSQSMSAMTSFAQINALIHRPPGLDGYRLIFDVSLRSYIGQWFREAVIEFG